MRVRVQVLTGVLACAAAALAPRADARPLTPAEQRYIPYSAQLPKCDDFSVVSTLQSRFDQRETYYWKSGLEMTRLERIRETGARTPGVDYIPRRYCEAKSVMNDRKTRNIYYSIGEDLNMTGGDAIRSVTQSLTFGLLPWVKTSPMENWGLEWCVVGLDRNYAYAMNCKAARP